MRVPPVTPAAFTAVMGTGIIATAAHSLPWQPPLLGTLATVWWLADAALLIILGGTLALRYATDHGAVRRDLLEPTVAPFFGALSMGILTVGSATLLVGAAHLGTPAAVTIDLALWTFGTLIGLASATVVPFLAFTRHRVAVDAATPVWLLPVVAPMVSAAGGALLADHVGPAAAQALALACYAQFGATAMASLALIAAVWQRLAVHQHRVAATAPALFIVLGPLGQSVTVAGLLADHAPDSIGLSRSAMTQFSILYGVPTLGFALLWLAIAAAVVVDAARRGLPYSMGWWAFTFPVGTCVTGATVLAQHTDSPLLAALAVALYGLLWCGWLLAAGGTVRHFARRARATRSASLSPVGG